ILTIVFTGLVVSQDATILGIIPMFLTQLVLGALIGLIFGKISTWFINHIRLDYEGLYIVLVIAIMFFTFSFTDFVGGNGFLAVYLSSVFLGNQELIHKKKILKSFDSFAWLMQIILFLTLGLLVYPSNIIAVFGIGILVSVFIIVIARPLSVFLCTIPFTIPIRHIWFYSWVGLIGAVPNVFATYPLLAGSEKANMIFNVVFFVSISSVIIQGTTISFVARLLKLTLPEELKKRTQKDMELSDGIKSLLTE